MAAGTATVSVRSDRVTEYRRRVLSERDRLVADLDHAADRQRAVLTDFLAANAGTAFGRAHRFGSLRTVDDYRSALPISDYDALAPWIDRAAAGERNVLSADDPVVFFRSSGSTGDSKKIPITRAFMRSTFFPFYYAAWAPFVEHFPDVVARDDSTLNLKHDPISRPPTTESGRPHLGASQVDFGTAFGEPLSAEPGTRAPWGTLPVQVADDDHLEKTYLRLRLAVESDVRCVIGINPAMVAALPDQLARWWPRIVRELRDGKVGGNRYGHPNPDRAAELERLASYHGGLLPAHVWPRLELIYCWTTNLAALYLPRLREAFGPGVTVLPAPVAASEGPTGVPLDRHPTAGPLVVSAALYEFADADTDLCQDTPTLLWQDLEPGHDYHVVFSHVGGLYRYAGGDVVRVVDRLRGVPRVEYAGRRNVSDVAGERLREAHVVRALSAALGAGGLDATNATCRPVGDTTPRYEFAIEFRLPVTPGERAALTARLDAELGVAAPTYRAARFGGALAEPVVHVLAPGAFAADWHDRVGSGIRPTQVKDRTFQRDDGAWRRLLASTLAGPAGHE